MKKIVSAAAFAVCFAFQTLAAEELFSDTDFSLGFKLTGADSRAVPAEVGTVFAKKGTVPLWRLAQWATKFSLLGQEEKISEKSKRIQSAGKLVEVRKDGGETVLRLEIFAGEEYGGKMRKQGEVWPHLLVSQSFESLPKISDMKSFTVSYQVKVSKAQFKGKGKPNKDLHAAQLVMFFILQDRNKNSKGYGDFLWFGLPIYDSRSDFPAEHRAADSGKADATAKYIYAVDGKKIWSKKLSFGRWNKFSFDVLGLMKEAFADAKKKGYLKNSELEDISVSSMNTGWEMPGPFDAFAEYKNISAKYEK